MRMSSRTQQLTSSDKNMVRCSTLSTISQSFVRLHTASWQSTLRTTDPKAIREEHTSSMRGIQAQSFGHALDHAFRRSSGHALGHPLGHPFRPPCSYSFGFSLHNVLTSSHLDTLDDSLDGSLGGSLGGSWGDFLGTDLGSYLGPASSVSSAYVRIVKTWLTATVRPHDGVSM